MRDKFSIKRFIAFLLCAAMIITYMPTLSVVYADETADDVVVETVETDPAPAPEPVADPEPAPATDPEPAVETPIDEPAPDAADPAPEAGDADAVIADPVDAEDVEEEIIEEEPEEDPAPVEEEYPAVTLSQTVNGVTVTLKAPEGSLPEGAKLRVSAVGSEKIFAAVENRLEAEGKEMTDAVAFDITPLDKDGSEIQPRVPVTVTFSGTGLEGGDVDVFRVSDDASVVTEMGTSVATLQKQVFSTDHFTIYVSTGSTSDPNGDGSGPNSQSNPYVLKYGDNITLSTSVTQTNRGWDINPSSSYASMSGTSTVTNTNRSTSEQIVRVRHRYGSALWPSSEYYYIKCLPQTFNVEFYLQDYDGNIELEKSVEVVGGTTVPAAEVPNLDPEKTVDGTTYTLYKWFTTSGWSTLANLETMKITEKTQFYARYAAEAKITYKANSSNSVTLPDPNPQADGVGNEVTIATAKCDGFALVKWTTEAGGGGDSYTAGQKIAMPANGLTLYAQWDEDVATITYHSQNQVFGDPQDVQKNSRVELITDIPTRQGYVFLGWDSVDFGTSATYYPGQTVRTTNASAYHLYAKWGRIADNINVDHLTAKGTTVTYDAEEHSIEGVELGNGVEAWDSQYVKVGEIGSGILKRYLLADISAIKASGVNAGNYTTPITAPIYMQYAIGSPVFQDEYVVVTNNVLTILPLELTITTDDAEKVYDGSPLTAGGKATYTDAEGSKHEIPFTAEGGLVNLVGSDTLNMKATGSQTEVGSSVNGFEYNWGKPDDWGTEASTAKSYNYQINASEDKLGTLTVYYGVKFDENTTDSVAGMPTGAKAYKNKDSGDIVAEIPSDTPAREHYEFLGWAKSADATEADCQPGGTITVTSDDVTDGYMTLYAVWKAKMFKVTFVDEDGTVISKKEYQEGTAAADIEKPADPTKAADGSYTYEFAGWSPEIADVTEDATYTATYTATPIPVTPDDDDDNPGGGGGGAAAAAAPIVPTAAGTDVADEPTPTTEPPATATIDDEPTPTTLTWAVGNLVMAVITALGAIIALFRKKEDDDDEFGDDGSDKKLLATKIAGALAGIAAPVTFFLTENMSNVPVAFDKWTALMAGILAVQAVSAVMGRAAAKASDIADKAKDAIN